MDRASGATLIPRQQHEHAEFIDNIQLHARSADTMRTMAPGTSNLEGLSLPIHVLVTTNGKPAGIIHLERDGIFMAADRAWFHDFLHCSGGDIHGE